jgi:hypothetical protein
MTDQPPEPGPDDDPAPSAWVVVDADLLARIRDALLALDRG